MSVNLIFEKLFCLQTNLIERERKRERRKERENAKRGNKKQDTKSFQRDRFYRTKIRLKIG